MVAASLAPLHPAAAVLLPRSTVPNLTCKLEHRQNHPGLTCPAYSARPGRPARPALHGLGAAAAAWLPRCPTAPPPRHPAGPANLPRSAGEGGRPPPSSADRSCGLAGGRSGGVVARLGLTSPAQWACRVGGRAAVRAHAPVRTATARGRPAGRLFSSMSRGLSASSSAVGAADGPAHRADNRIASGKWPLPIGRGPGSETYGPGAATDRRPRRSDGSCGPTTCGPPSMCPRAAVTTRCRRRRGGPALFRPAIWLAEAPPPPPGGPCLATPQSRSCRPAPPACRAGGPASPRRAE